MASGDKLIYMGFFKGRFVEHDVFYVMASSKTNI